MSRRGRRRNSKRRKSSSSSKQSVSPYIFEKQNKSNSVSYNDIVEKGETDSLRKENVLSESEDEEKYNNAPPKEKRFKQDHHLNSFPNQRSIYCKTLEDRENGVRTVTSVSVNDMEDSFPNIIVQHSREPLSDHRARSTTPVTNVMKINCTMSHLQLEIQETFQPNSSGSKTMFVFMNEKGDCAKTFPESQCEKTWTLNNESPEQPHHTTNNRFNFVNTKNPTEAHRDSTNIWEDPNVSDHKPFISTGCMSANDPSSLPAYQKHFPKSICRDELCSIPPPQEFADLKYNTLDDLTRGLASCRIGARSPADKQQRELQPEPNTTWEKESRCPFPAGAEETAPLFDQLSESANDELMNRSSFTKDFINCQKRKCWIRNNSIATVERRARLIPKKRHQTFPGMSEGFGWMFPCSDSFSSLVMCSLLVQTERLGRFPQGTDSFTASGTGDYNSSRADGSSKLLSENSQDGKQSLLSSFYLSSSEENPDDVFTVSEAVRQQSIAMDMENVDTIDQSEVADSGFDQEMWDVDYHSPKVLTIQVIPPSCSGSQEQILPSDPAASEHLEHPASHLPKHSDSARTATAGSLLQRLLHMDSPSPQGSFMELQVLEDVNSLNTYEIGPKPFSDETGSTRPILPLLVEQTNDLQLDSARRTEESDQWAASCPARGSREEGFPTDAEPRSREEGSLTDAEPHSREEGSLTDAEPRSREEGSLTDAGPRSREEGSPTDAEPHSREEGSPTDAEPHSREAEEHVVSRPPSEAKEHLKLVVQREPESSDHWAKRRKLFKESQQWSSIGGSSITSDITEDSVSEENRSVDMTVKDYEDRGFYTDTFHSSAWIYQGDHVDSAAVPPSLNARTQAVSSRERTVRVSKGTGEYPWGFRIQFSNPIVVTEVDTNGAAEEAGLMVGDAVLAVNGTDVTSIPHSEAADLARRGPDVLTLTIGSDIARSPNTPRPACRGYLHKRTQTGLIKGWRKRWFVLTHDCCLFYYRHKRDEGKRRALSAVKLEGAEVGPDISLGKPFVFKCRPQSGSRVYFFCTTSNQDMKRWLEAMEKAIHPVTQKHVWLDVTRHNSNLPPLAVKNPDCLGLLHKMDRHKDVWLQHYCILKDGCLYLYSGIRATHAHGGIYLQGYMVREQPYGSKKSTIELKPPSDEFKTFHFCAENPTENKRWVIAIKASVKKWLPLHQALQEYMSRPSEETRM